MPKPGEKKAPAKSGKTDQMRALREEQHRKFLADRAERERAEKVAAKNPKKPAPAPPPPGHAPDDASVYDEPPPLDNAVLESGLDASEEMPLTFKLWKKACEALRPGRGIDWVTLEDAADEAFGNGVLPSEFVAESCAESETEEED